MTRRQFQALTAAAAALPELYPADRGVPAITADADGTFTVENGYIIARLRVLPSGGLECIMLARSGGRNLIAPRSPAFIYRKAGGHVSFGIRDNSEFRFVRHEIVEESSPELRLHFDEPRRAISYVLHIRIMAGVPVIETWIDIANTGEKPLTIERFDPLLLALAIPPTQYSTLHYVQGCQDYGAGRGVGTSLRPFGPYRVRKVRIAPGDNHTLLNTAPFYANARRSTSSSENLNWFAVESGPEHDGVFGGLQWSGEWALDFTHTGDRVVIHGGVHYATKTLAPGQTLMSPKAFTGVCRGDVDSGLHDMHRYLRAHVIAPRPDDNFPWVCYNTWYAWDISLDEAKLRREAGAAARIGIECFYIDAGWYRGSPAKGSFSLGLGDWVGNEKFPSGLRVFSDSIHALGMKFGLWVEPERVDGALIGRAGSEIRPSWVATRDAARIVRADGSAQICFGNPDVVAWSMRALEHVVRDYAVEWLKWDHNF